MAVVAIVAVMGAIAMATMSGASNGQGPAAFARSLQFVIMTARNKTLSDGFIRSIVCTPASTNSTCVVSRACQAGMTLPNACTFTTESKVAAGNHATLWNVTSTNDVTTSNAGGSQVTTTKTLYLKPDGSVCDVYASTASPAAVCTSSGFTFYVSDINGSNAANKYKIYIYPLTGMPRMVNQW